ncbi:MAG: transaldolase [Planctomycetes bacterium]|nr:transaldolase [Planctomycetota bacterium]
MAATDLAQRMHDLVRSIGDDGGKVPAKRSPFWAGLTALGSRLWLDTGDIAAAEALWCDAFSGLTTNNTLLNKEVQTGAYDAFIPQAAGLVADLGERDAVLEIAFALNARHGLRLVHRFGAWVSVELHTDLAHDAERSIAYGLRYHAICPERFIVKIPFTAAGLLAARALGERGIPVNFTLGFSARQNHLITAFARPAYVNVFLGRLNAYVKDNGLGSGDLVGEKAMLASQREVTALDHGKGRTKHIAASLRSAAQVRALGGCDVYTIPTAVAAAAVKELDGTWSDQREARHEVVVSGDPRALGLERLWEVTKAERALAADLAAKPPSRADELVARAHAAGCGDLFPRMSDADNARIAADGKIPKHPAWAARIAAGELAIDSLLSLAALASFSADQAALDRRIVENRGR